MYSLDCICLSLYLKSLPSNWYFPVCCPWGLLRFFLNVGLTVRTRDSYGTALLGSEGGGKRVRGERREYSNQRNDYRSYINFDTCCSIKDQK